METDVCQRRILEFSGEDLRSVVMRQSTCSYGSGDEMSWD